jgi:hypothetical protein
MRPFTLLFLLAVGLSATPWRVLIVPAGPGGDAADSADPVNSHISRDIAQQELDKVGSQIDWIKFKLEIDPKP